MLKGSIERRLDQRIPCQGELIIKFERNGNKTVTGTATNISPGGLEFSVPWGSSAAYVGEMVQLVFDLPDQGRVEVRGQIRHERSAANAGDNPMLMYGVKFLDLSEESWSRIVAFCQESGADVNDRFFDSALLDERGGLLSLTKQMRKGRPLGLSLTVAVVLSEGRRLEGRIEDAGFGGLEVSLSEPLPIGDTVGIHLDQGKLQLDTSARCVWCHPIGDLKDRWLTGLRLTGQAKDQFAQLRELILALVRSTH